VNCSLEGDGVIGPLGHVQNYTYGNVENGDLKVFVQKEGSVVFSMFSEQRMGEEVQ
jgi:hypothetical protein